MSRVASSEVFEAAERGDVLDDDEFLGDKNKLIDKEINTMANGSGGNSWDDVRQAINRLEQGESEDIEEDYQVILDRSRSGDLGPDQVVDIYRAQISLEEAPVDTGRLDEVLDEYFEELYDPSRVERLRQGIRKPETVEDVIDSLEEIEQGWEALVEQSSNEPSEDGLEVEKNRYLLAVRDYIG